jgi:hypothetical protein
MNFTAVDFEVVRALFANPQPDVGYKRVGKCIIELMKKEDGKTPLQTNETRTVIDKRFAKYRANYICVTDFGRGNKKMD